MRWSFLPAGLIAIALMSSGSASACEWTNDAPPGYYNGCADLDAVCVANAYCLTNAPPQIVDKALYCVLRAPSQADDLAETYVQTVWDWGVDFPTSLVDDPLQIAHDETEDEVDALNEDLCRDVWSFFCSNPITVPRCLPVGDPAGATPPSLLVKPDPAVSV